MDSLFADDLITENVVTDMTVRWKHSHKRQLRSYEELLKV